MVIKKSDIREIIQNVAVLLLLVMSVLVTFYNTALNMPFYIILIFLFVYFYVYRNHCKIEYKIIPIIIYGIITIGTTFVNEFMSSEGISTQYLWRPIKILMLIVIGYYYAIYTKEKNRYRLYKIFYFAMLISIIYGFYQYIAGIGWGYNSRMDSFFGHPIVYGSLLLLAFWMTFYLTSNFVVRLICGIYIGLGLLSTGSRSAWIALLISMVIWLFKIKKYKLTKKRFYVFLCAIVGMIIFSFTTYFDNIFNIVFQRVSGTMQGVSAAQRLGSYGYIFTKMISGNPIGFLFGHGEGAAANIMGNTTIALSAFYTTDSQYLTLMYDYGIVVFAMIIVLLITIIKKYFSQSQRNSELEMLSLGIVSGGYITAIFYDLYGWLSISTVLMIFIGIYLGTVAKGEKDEIKRLS